MNFSHDEGENVINVIN